MKHFFYCILFFGAFTMKAQSPLDITFGNNGIALFPDFYADHGVSVGMQSDGKILCYYTSSVSCFGHYIFRLMTNGAIDTTFDPSLSYHTTPNYVKGVFFISASGLPSPGQTFIRQTLGGDILVGISPYSIVKIKTNGLVDSSFGNYPNVPGYANLNILSTTPVMNIFYDFYEDPTGAYYFACPNPNQDSLLIGKTFTNGQLDNSYGINGIKSIPFNAGAFGGTVTLSGANFSSTGDIFIFGHTYNGAAGNNACLAKYNLAGNLQTSFGTNGVVIKDFAFDEAFSGLTQSSNGDLFVNGFTSSPADIYSLKLNSSGIMDMTFGSSGKKSYPYPSTAINTPIVNGIPFAFNTPLYTTVSYTPSFMVWNQNYQSITNTGLDNTQFGTNGTWNPGANYRIDQMISQPDGKIICLGSDSAHARVLRYVSNKPNGMIDMSIQKLNVWQSDHQVFITSNGNKKFSISNAYICSMVGKIVSVLDVSNLPKQLDKQVLQLPENLVRGIYILSLKFGNEVQNLKIQL